MASSSPARKLPQHQCHGILARLAYRHAREKGLDVLPLLGKAGLSKHVIHDQGAMIGVVSQMQFVHDVADTLHDDLFGFHLVQEADLREVGLLYYIMASAETLGDALLRLERYIQVANEGVALKIEKAAAVRATLSYSGIPRHADQHQISAVIFLLIRAARHLTGRTLKPTRVRIAHSIKGGARLAGGILSSIVEDGAEVDRVEFPAESWGYRIISADPYLHRSCVNALEEALVKKRRIESSLKAKVQNEIAALMPHGQARHDIVAERLGLSSRTLARRLSDEGVSFAEILSEMRSSLARRYIADRSMSISQIAWMLGYAEIGTFTRAYQRWTGRAPSAARNQL